MKKHLPVITAAIIGLAGFALPSTQADAAPTLVRISTLRRAPMSPIPLDQLRNAPLKAQMIWAGNFQKWLKAKGYDIGTDELLRQLQVAPIITVQKNEHLESMGGASGRDFTGKNGEGFDIGEESGIPAMRFDIAAGVTAKCLIPCGNPDLDKEEPKPAVPPAPPVEIPKARQSQIGLQPLFRVGLSGNVPKEGSIAITYKPDKEKSLRFYGGVGATEQERYK
ncbi:MAG: hypothetical protein HGA33_03715 [Candidatus Moranbacteria bacterium]|nr:hypothetical protein [Candidatus Moranbacteria bacterium]